MKRTGLKRKLPKDYELDSLYGKVIKLLVGGKCELCGVKPTNSKSYHIHHYITRTVRRLRWDPRNTICVCAQCHADLEKDPKLNTEVFTKRLGSEGLDELRRQIYTAPKADRVAIKEQLKARLKQLEEIDSQEE